MSHFSRRHIMSAGAWTLGGNVIGQLIRLGSNLIMTRLLVPEMFAMMAVASVVFMGVGMMSDIGLRQKIVQSKRGDDPVFLNTIWVLQILRGSVIWLLALIASLGLYVAGQYSLLPTGTVYADPKLPMVLVAVCFSAVISGLQSTKTATLMRNLARRSLVMMELTGQLAGLVAMLAWSMFDRSIWVLVVGGLASALAVTIISHFWLPGERNHWTWDSGVFKEVFHFGKWMFVASMLGFLINQGDRLLLGAILAPAQLGVYVIAFFIVNAITAILNKLLGNIAFPVLSKISNTSPGQLKSTYYRLRLPLDAALFFLVGILFESGHLIIQLLYDARYTQAGPMLEILSLSLLALRYNMVDQCYLALGQVRTFAGVCFIKAAALFILVPLANYYDGINGVLWAIVASYFAAVPYTLYFKYKYGFLDVRQEFLTVPILFIGILFGKLFALVLGFGK